MGGVNVTHSTHVANYTGTCNSASARLTEAVVTLNPLSRDGHYNGHLAKFVLSQKI